MYSSPILQLTSIQIAQIKTSIEEEFIKTYGKSYNWSLLLKNPSIRKIMQDQKIVSTIPEDVSLFREELKKVLRNSGKYQMIEEVNQKDSKTMTVKIKRNNKYDGITDYKSLVELVKKHPGGLQVDQELTSFTFRQAKAEIQRAVGQKMIKKMYKENTKDEHYYIFPKQLQIQYEIRQDSFKYFPMTEYLQLCSHLNSIDENDEKVKEAKSTNTKETTGDPNYKLPGYLQQKQKWLKRGLKK